MTIKQAIQNLCLFIIFLDGFDTLLADSSRCPLKGNFTNGNWSRFLHSRSVASAPLSNNVRVEAIFGFVFQIQDKPVSGHIS